jgi:DNA recombination protein RmuC
MAHVWTTRAPKPASPELSEGSGTVIHMEPIVLVSAALLLGLLLGLAAGVPVGRGQGQARNAALGATLQAERRAAAERLAALQGEQARLAEQFRALSAEALSANNAQFLDLAEARLREAQVRAGGDLDRRSQAVAGLVAPLDDTLRRVEARLHDLEAARVGAYAALTEQVAANRVAAAELTAETAALVNALRAPQSRGRWGELQLRRVVELAGMEARCDFDEQVGLTLAGSVVRPDLVVRLAGGRSVVVDSKVTLAAYLEAAGSSDAAHREERLRAHARHLRGHVDALAAKEYWTALPDTPEFVVLFVPGEAFLAPALERDAGLLEHAMARRVMIATPTTLVAMLRTVAWSWQQESLTESAREVFELGRELYARLATMGEHVDRLGRSLGRAVTDYNAATGSLESRVLVTARRLHGLGVVSDELPIVRGLDHGPRPLTAAELTVPAAEAARLRPL